MGRLRHADTYGKDERGIAYRARALWRRSSRSSRRSNGLPGRTGKRPQGEGEQVIGYSRVDRSPSPYRSTWPRSSALSGPSPNSYATSRAERAGVGRWPDADL